MFASECLVSGGPSTGIPRHPTTDDTCRVPVFSASGPQQTASTSQSSQPNQRLMHDSVGLAQGPIMVQSALPPVPQYQPATMAQSMSNRPAARTHKTNQPQEANTGKGRQTVNNSQGTPTVDSGTDPIFSLMSTRMSELIAVVNASSEAHKEDMQQLRMEFNGLLELNHLALNGKSESSGTQASSQARNEPVASRASRQRKQPRLEDKYRGQPGHTKFRQSIQKHFLRLLHITDYSCLDQLLPPPSDDEILAFNRHDLGCIKITPNNFCIDLSRSRRTPFNTEAIRIFAKDFKRKVEENKWYSFPTPPATHFLQSEYIELSLFLHLHHVKDVYANSKKSQEARHARLRSAARSMHKTRLYTSRADCVANDDRLVAHNDLMQLIGSQGVSSDESDTGLEGQKVYRMISPAWRSEELADLMRSIDSTIISNRRPRVGHRAIRGQEPRQRIPSDLVNEDAVAPPGLPLNCYKESWLMSLLPSERNKLKAIMNKSYNFENGRTECCSTTCRCYLF
ncbi:hypothetical protein EV401DRAFT_1167181 [Pisolithus croceorrhizus]|nr:hypothetical protein EV401DRAFT_1167181 [Pisolithus croceorrhizus]